MIARVIPQQKGSLPLSQSFIRVLPSNIILTSLKKEEDGNAWILQWYESAGKDTEVSVGLPKQPAKVFTSNFLEEDGKPVAFKGKTVTVLTKANSITTVKVLF